MCKIFRLLKRAPFAQGLSPRSTAYALSVLGAMFHVPLGKWVTFYKDGEEVWACNAIYAAAHFDFSPAPSGGVSRRHDDLDDMVQSPECQVLGNEDAPPNRRTKAAQSNAKLKDGDRRSRIGSHARIVGASLAS
ncbi:hypothetical protein Tamer19_45870 [Cupriavidus sp. TA19]|nr:hypothetical protein Tamer19_45870 [Cupriavidus sp. TA19]